MKIEREFDMKTTSRLILSVLLAIVLTSLPLLENFQPLSYAYAQEDVESDEPVKIDGLFEEKPAVIPDEQVNFTLTVGNSCSYSTIALAIAAANDGDLILLEGGRTFNENNLVITDDIAIEGGYAGCASGSTAPTTVDGTSTSFVFEVGSASVTLRNLIITGGNTTNGGGVRALSLSSVTLDHTKVENNVAINGGGLYIGTDSTITLTNDSDIRLNAAILNGGGARVWGTLIAYDWNSTIYNNQAPNGGGLSVPGGEVDFAGSHIQNNQATDAFGVGGGIHVFDEGSVSLLNSSNIMGNSAYNGGGIFADNATLELAAVVHSNSALNAGGGIYLDNASGLVANNTYIGYVFSNPSSGRNTAINGGGLYVNANSTVNFNGVMVNNHAAEDGGAIHMSSTSGNVEINSTDIAGNTGRDGGGALVDGGNLLLTGPLRIETNTASRYGGAIAVRNSGAASIRASDGKIEILENQALGGGGAFFTNNVNTFILYATSSYALEIYLNTGGYFGGAGFADNTGYFDIYGQVEIHDNTAAIGGAFLLVGGSRIWFDDYATITSRLYNNIAQAGGAVYAINSPAVRFDGAVIGSELGGNQATVGSGGAIYLLNSNLDAENTVFLNNQAAEHGGAIYAEGSTLNIDTNLSTPALAAALAELESEARSGSSIQASACNPLVKECSAFAGNIADSDANNAGLGGAIYLTESTMTLSQTHLHHNSAYYGGAIFQTGSSSASTVSNSLLHHNSVTYALGAGIRRSAGNFTLSHVTITDNSGGAGFSGQATSASNTIAWESGIAGFTLPPLSYACNIDSGGNAGPNIDPLFVNPAAGQDYHLRSGSPAIDVCPTGGAVDIQNRPRPFGEGYDIGAYEFSGHTLYLPLLLR